MRRARGFLPFTSGDFRLGGVVLVLLGFMGSACGPSTPVSRPPISREDRLQVLRCYADAYEFRYRVKVDLTKSDLEAAESLYGQENGSVKQTCDLLKRAFLNEECKQVTLEALARDPNYCVITQAQMGAKPNINPARLQEWKQRPMIENPDGSRRRDL